MRWPLASAAERSGLSPPSRLRSKGLDVWIKDRLHSKINRYSSTTVLSVSSSRSKSKSKAMDIYHSQKVIYITKSKGNRYNFLGLDRIFGSVSGIWQNPAIFQLSGIRPETKYLKTGYLVSEYLAEYPANRILIRHFYSCLKIWDVSIIWVTLSMSEISGIRFSKWPDIRQNCYPVHPYYFSQ